MISSNVVDKSAVSRITDKHAFASHGMMWIRTGGMSTRNTQKFTTQNFANSSGVKKNAKSPKTVYITKRQTRASAGVKPTSRVIASLSTKQSSASHVSSEIRTAAVQFCRTNCKPACNLQKIGWKWIFSERKQNPSLPVSDKCSHSFLAHNGFLKIQRFFKDTSSRLPELRNEAFIEPKAA